MLSFSGVFYQILPLFSKSNYADAVVWAVENGVTSGTGNNQFSPNADCTRAQIVTFLYRCMK